MKYTDINQSNLNSFDIQLAKNGIPEMLSIDKAIQKMDKTTEGRIDLQNIRKHLTAGGNDILVLIKIHPSKLVGYNDADVDINYANTDKGAVIIDSNMNIIDGRHRTALAASTGEYIFAYIPVKLADLVLWHKQKQ